MATGWPEYSFVLGNKKPILYIGEYQLPFNRIKQNNDGEKTAYFYCVSKVKHGKACSSSARAMVVDNEASGEPQFLLAKYNGNHSESCIPNSAQLEVKAVKAAIKNTILSDQTLKQTVVYNREVASGKSLTS